MNQPVDLSMYKRRIKRIRAIPQPLRRVNRLVRLATKAGLPEAIDLMLLAVEEASKINNLLLLEPAVDELVDGYTDLGLFMQALAVTTKSENAVVRAAWYALIHAAATVMGHEEGMERSKQALQNARPQLNKQELAELDQMLSLLADV